MKRYIVFERSIRRCIHAMQVDFLKLKASFPNVKFIAKRNELTISCDNFEVRYISVQSCDELFMKSVECDGVYDSHLLPYPSYSRIIEKFTVLENNEFLVWLREGDLIL